MIVIIIFLMLFNLCQTGGEVNYAFTRILSQSQNNQLKYELLNMLDLPKKHPPFLKEKMKYSSKFLIELYTKLSDNQRDSNRIRRDTRYLETLREDEVNKGILSDVIVTLNSVNKKSDGVGKRQKLSFLTETLPNATGLFGAELKLYQSSKLETDTSHQLYKISVYKKVSNNGTKMKKVAEKLTTKDYNGWLSIEISFTFNMWLQNITINKDLYISAKPFGVDNEKEIHPALIGIIFQHEKTENEPFIVAFLKAENKVKARVPRNIMQPQTQKENLLSILEKNATCSLHALRVSFKDLGWDDWVIAPEGYTSAFCYGSCVFPIKFPAEVTNHAIIQSLVQLKNPNKFPKPSCAPTSLNTLSVLYRDKENTVLKKYKNMIAASCGCQ